MTQMCTALLCHIVALKAPTRLNTVTSNPHHFIAAIIFYAAMGLLSDIMQQAIKSNDLEKIRAEFSTRPIASQGELDDCLILAMPQGSLEMIELLLQLGSRLKQASFLSAINRDDPTVFRLLIASGWDINSTAFERSAVQ